MPVKLGVSIAARLTVAIDGKIYLSQPLNCRQADIHTFIHTHLDWLAARARSLETQATQPSPYAAGSKYWLLGEALRLVLTDGAPRTIRRDGDCLITAPGDEKTLATAFRRFHLAESAARFPALVAQEAARCPWVKALPPLRYRAMQRRWVLPQRWHDYPEHPPHSVSAGANRLRYRA